MFCKLKETHRKACNDFCDLAGRDDNYVQAFVIAIILDFALPIISIIIGFQLAIFTVVGTIFAFIIDIWLGVVTIGVFGITWIIFSGIGIVITILLIILMGRQIGLFVGLAVVSELLVIGLTSIPEIGIIFTPFGFVPWYLLAVIIHMLIYKGLCKN